MKCPDDVTVVMSLLSWFQKDTFHWK